MTPAACCAARSSAPPLGTNSPLGPPPQKTCRFFSLPPLVCLLPFHRPLTHSGSLYPTGAASPSGEEGLGGLRLSSSDRAPHPHPREMEVVLWVQT